MLELSLRVAGSIPAVGRFRFIGTSCRFLLTDICENTTILVSQPNLVKRTLSLWSILGGRQSKKLTTSLVDFACVLELLSLFEGILTSVVAV